MSETAFRIAAGLILFSSVGISAYFRNKADKQSGEAIPRSVDGRGMSTLIRIGGLTLWFFPLLYLARPHWMEWSSLALPMWVRWLAVAWGILCVAGVYWLFISIGRGISPTSATRKEHPLVIRGPYRWVRHPLYTIGSSLFVSFGVIAANWFIALLGVFAFVLMATRTPKEEANLIAKFGDEYRDYMKHTGRYFPRLWRVR